MSTATDAIFASLRKQIRVEAMSEFRDALIRDILIGPWSSEEHGPGFAIFIGADRVGWFASRMEACDVGHQLGQALIASDAETRVR